MPSASLLRLHSPRENIHSQPPVARRILPGPVCRLWLGQYLHRMDDDTTWRDDDQQQHCAGAFGSEVVGAWSHFMDRSNPRMVCFHIWMADFMEGHRDRHSFVCRRSDGKDSCTYFAGSHPFPGAGTCHIRAYGASYHSSGAHQPVFRGVIGGRLFHSYVAAVWGLARRISEQCIQRSIALVSGI